METTRAKIDLTAQVLDELVFQGPAMSMLKATLGMMGIPSVSIQLISQGATERLMKSFLDCLNSMLLAAQDETVNLELYSQLLANNIQELMTVMREEKANAATVTSDTRESTRPAIGKNVQRKKLFRKATSENVQG